MRIFFALAVGLLFVAAAPALAQPHIQAVVSGADFSPGIALGGIGTVFGTGLSDKQYQFSALPFPVKLGPTDVFVCLAGKISQFNESTCQALQLIFVSPSQINFLLFDSLPNKPGFTGTLSIVVRVNGVIDDGATSGSSMGIELMLTNLQAQGYGGLDARPFTAEPRIFSEGYDCFIDSRYQYANRNCGLTFIQTTTLDGTPSQADRGAVTDQQGRVLSSSNPARVGQYYTIWLTGLGPFAKGAPVVGPFTMDYTNVPVYGYKGSTYLPAGLSYIGRSPQFPGVYQVNFQLSTQIAGLSSTPGYPAYPPLFPCGDYNWEISLSIWQGADFPVGQPANIVQIPVVIKQGDVACVQIPVMAKRGDVAAVAPQAVRNRGEGGEGPVGEKL